MKPTLSLLDFDIQAQPDDFTCGPTCLHALYNYFGDTLSLDQVISEVKNLHNGGTLATLLGYHALKRGYQATLYTYHLSVFDPTWFEKTKEELILLLKDQLIYKNGRKLRIATEAYIRFLEAGGTIAYRDLNQKLFTRHLNDGIPLLTGVSATYLYGTPREIEATNMYDSLRGTPAGHFVVINGIDKKSRKLLVADPIQTNPYATDRYYSVKYDRLVTAILLGIETYDANILIIKPK